MRAAGRLPAAGRANDDGQAGNVFLRRNKSGVAVDMVAEIRAPWLALGVAACPGPNGDAAVSLVDRNDDD